MTLSPALIVPGTGQPARHYGWNGVRLMMSDALAAQFTLGHLFGSDFNGVFPSDYSGDKSIGDHSWNGRHAVNMGAAPGAKSFTSGIDAYYLEPLTLTELLALGGGKCSWFAVGKWPNSNGAMGPWNGSTVDGMVFGRSGSTHRVRVAYADSGKTDIDSSFLAEEAGDYYQTQGVTIDNIALEIKYYRHRAGGSLQTVTLPLTHPVASALYLPVGRTSGSQYVGGIELVGSFCFQDVVSFVSFRANLKTFLAGYSVTI